MDSDRKYLGKGEAEGRGNFLADMFIILIVVMASWVYT